MSKYVIVGAGPVGTAVAEILLARGDEPIVVTRRGSGPQGTSNVALDASDSAALTALTEGSTALFNCANPAYHRWASDWPPLAEAMLSAARASGATLVIASNLYGYGPVTQPMTPRMPLHAATTKGRVRAAMWQNALAAHERGEVAVVEVRGSDYLGAGEQSHFDRGLPALLAGKKVRVIGDPDMPHSWTAVPDMARILVAAADDPEAWGRPWHALVAADVSQRAGLAQAAQLAGLAEPTVVSIPGWQLRLVGLFNKAAAELPEVSYQFEAPFISDDSETRTHFGIDPTPWPTVLGASLAAAGHSAAEVD